MKIDLSILLLSNNFLAALNLLSIFEIEIDQN